MSAQIIPFPGATGKASDQALRAMVVIDQMRAFRVLGASTMRDLSMTQHTLVSLIRAYESGGTVPSLEELKDLMWDYAASIRRIDYADKFLVVHGEPVADADSYEVLRSKCRREISHQSITHDIRLSEVLRGLDNE